MKYRVFVEKDTHGKPLNYGIAFKFMWWWIPCGAVGYFKRKDAEAAVAAMNGTREIL